MFQNKPFVEKSALDKPKTSLKKNRILRFFPNRKKSNSRLRKLAAGFHAALVPCPNSAPRDRRGPPASCTCPVGNVTDVLRLLVFIIRCERDSPFGRRPIQSAVSLRNPSRKCLFILPGRTSSGFIMKRYMFRTRDSESSDLIQIY